MYSNNSVVAGWGKCLLASLIISFGSIAGLSQEATIASEKPAAPILISTNLHVPVIVVSGHGDVEAPPDRAVIRLGVQSEARDAAEAQNAVNDVIRKAAAAIKKLDIPGQSIRTVGLNLVPVYETPKPGRETRLPRIIGYRAMNILQVELNADNLGRVGKVVDRGLESGANRLDGLSFELSKDTPQRTRALRMAVEEARAKAQAMADALGLRLLGVEEATESGVSVMPRPRMMRAMEARAQVGVPTQVEPGALHVEASVNIRYRIGPQNR